MLEPAFSNETCRDLIDAINTQEEIRWYRRTRINSIPAGEGRACAYDFLGDAQQFQHLNRILRQLAPKIPGHDLGEACINRYRVGDWMPPHRDRAFYRLNVVIPLQALGDGVCVEDELWEDVVGQATVFPAHSCAHQVPPVTHQRFVIVYLYR